MQPKSSSPTRPLVANSKLNVGGKPPLEAWRLLSPAMSVLLALTVFAGFSLTLTYGQQYQQQQQQGFVASRQFRDQQPQTLPVPNHSNPLKPMQVIASPQPNAMVRYEPVTEAGLSQQLGDSRPIRELNQELRTTSTARQLVLVPGSEPINPLEEEQFSYPIILPSENYKGNLSKDIENSYIIDRKRFVEGVPSRCLASTILERPAAVEPAFIIISETNEVRLNATASAAAIDAAGFDPNKRTTILVHGFTQSYPNTTWLRKARAVFQMNYQLARQNLIIMDWGAASQGSYSAAAAYVSGMGSFLSNFIMKLIGDLGANRMSIHIVGHSLGAHLAGFAGKRIRPRLGRITALDAAGPCFGKILSNSPSDRLAPDDAYEVDAYHYDDDFLGLPGQHGQFDVLVNGGSSQPGCTDNMNTMLQAMITMVFRRNRALSESHTRSTEVATTKLSSLALCQQVAYECRDWVSFYSGECGKCNDSNSQCFMMGFEFQYEDMPDLPLRTSSPGKRFYISTGSSELFCQNHYQVLVKFEPFAELGQLAKRNKWQIQVDFFTDQQEHFNATITHQMKPHTYSYLLLTEMRPMRIVEAQLQVRSFDGTQVQLNTRSSPFKVFAVDVNFMSNFKPELRRSMSSRLCPTANKIRYSADLPPAAPSTSGQEENSILGSSTNLKKSSENQFGSYLQFEECSDVQQ